MFFGRGLGLLLQCATLEIEVVPVCKLADNLNSDKDQRSMTEKSVNAVSPGGWRTDDTVEIRDRAVGADGELTSDGGHAAQGPPDNGAPAVAGGCGDAESACGRALTVAGWSIADTAGRASSAAVGRWDRW